MTVNKEDATRESRAAPSLLRNAEADPTTKTTTTTTTTTTELTNDLSPSEKREQLSVTIEDDCNNNNNFVVSDIRNLPTSFEGSTNNVATTTTTTSTTTTTTDLPTNNNHTLTRCGGDNNDRPSQPNDTPHVSGADNNKLQHERHVGTDGVSLGGGANSINNNPINNNNISNDTTPKPQGLQPLRGGGTNTPTATNEPPVQHPHQTAQQLPNNTNNNKRNYQQMVHDNQPYIEGGGLFKTTYYTSHILEVCRDCNNSVAPKNNMSSVTNSQCQAIEEFQSLQDEYVIRLKGFRNWLSDRKSEWKSMRFKKKMRNDESLSVTQRQAIVEFQDLQDEYVIKLKGLRNWLSDRKSEWKLMRNNKKRKIISPPEHGDELYRFYNNDVSDKSTYMETQKDDDANSNDANIGTNIISQNALQHQAPDKQKKKKKRKIHASTMALHSVANIDQYFHQLANLQRQIMFSLLATRASNNPVLLPAFINNNDVGIQQPPMYYQLVPSQANSTDGRTEKRERPKSFQQRIEDLKAYKQKHGHLNVKKKDDPSLYQFCTNAKHTMVHPNKKAKLMLDQDRIAALEKLGFCWSNDASFDLEKHKAELLKKLKLSDRKTKPSDKKPAKKPAAAPVPINRDLINSDPKAKSCIEKPGPNDVMSGARGRHHPGNIKFRRIVEASAYGNKYVIAMKIVSDWRALNPPGRFLMMNKQTGLWDDIGNEEAIKSTSQKLEKRSSRDLSPSDIAVCENDTFCGQEFDNMINDFISEAPGSIRRNPAPAITRKRPRYKRFYAGGPVAGSSEVETPHGSGSAKRAQSGVTNETTDPFETPHLQSEDPGGTSGIALGSQALDSDRRSNPRDAAAAMHIQRPIQYQEQELQQYPRDDMVSALFKRYTVTFYPTGTDAELGILLRSLDRNLTVCMLKHDHLAIKAIGTGPLGEQFKIQVGDMVIPTIQNDATLPTQDPSALLTWFTNKLSRARDNINGMTVSFWRPIQGTFEERAAFYQPIIEELKVRKDRDYNNDTMYVSVSSIGTSQAINDDGAQGSCSAICLSIIEKHVMRSGFNMSGVTLDGIKESIDTDGPGLMQEVSGTVGGLVTDDDIISYMQRKQRLSKLHNNGVIYGNVLCLEDTLKICEGISRSVGKCGGALYFNEHTVTILRSPSPYESSQTNDEPYIYEFIESLPSNDHEGHGYKIVCTKLSCLHTVIQQYFFDKMRQMNDIETIASKPWSIQEVNHGDPRLFYVHLFASPALPDPDEGKGNQPAYDSIVGAVDKCFKDGHRAAGTFVQAVSVILDFDVESMTSETKAVINNRFRVLLNQPSIVAIKNVVDELYTRTPNDNIITKEGIIDEIVHRHEMNVELTDASCGVIDERIKAWRKRSNKAVAKLEECNNYEVVKVYPSIMICAQEEQLHLNQLTEDLRGRGHLRTVSHLYYRNRSFFWLMEKPRLTASHISALFQGEQTKVEKLVVTGELVQVLKKYDSAFDCFNDNQGLIVDNLSQPEQGNQVDEVEIARQKFMDQMTTGGMMIRNGGENNDEIHYYRYVVSHKKAPVYTHGHILAIANGTVENVVEVFELPNIETPLTPTQLGFDESEYISINQCQQKFGVGSRHLAINLRRGGYVQKYRGKIYWIQHKYPFKLSRTSHYNPNAHVVKLSRDELVIKCAEALRKCGKRRVNIARRDCREAKRLSRDSGSLLENLVNGVDNHYHATVVPPRAMERSDDDKQNGNIYVKPISMLSDETKMDLDILFNKSSHDVYSVKRFLHCCRVGQRKTKREPHETFYILELYIESTDQHTTPVGLVADGTWKTQGCEATWKTNGSVRVKRIIEVHLGSLGNLCDKDTSINIIRDNGDMDTELCENVKRGLNQHSDHYNHGLFHQGEDSDDESVGLEQRFAGEDNANIFNQDFFDDEEVETAVEDITSNATIDGYNVRIEIDHLSEDTIALPAKLLRRSFNEAQSQWKSNNEDLNNLEIFTPNNREIMRVMLKLNLEPEIENDKMYWTRTF